MVLLLTSMGFCPSDASACIYLNCSAVLRLEGHGHDNVGESVLINLDLNLSRRLLQALKKDGHDIQGIEAWGGDSAIPMNECESAPLHYCKSLLQSTRFVVISLGFKGCESSFRGMRCASSGSITNITDRVKLGKSLGKWISSSENCARRIFLIQMADLSYRSVSKHLQISQSVGALDHHPYSNISSPSTIAGKSKACDEFDKGIIEWVYTCDPEALFTTARPLLPKTNTNCFDGIVVLHGLLEGKNQSHLDTAISIYACVNGLGMLAATLLPKWNILPSVVQALNTGNIQIFGGDEKSCSCRFSKSSAFSDFEGEIKFIDDLSVEIFSGEKNHILVVPAHFELSSKYFKHNLSIIYLCDENEEIGIDNHISAILKTCERALLPGMLPSIGPVIFFDKDKRDILRVGNFAKILWYPVSCSESSGPGMLEITNPLEVADTNSGVKQVADANTTLNPILSRQARQQGAINHKSREIQELLQQLKDLKHENNLLRQSIEKLHEDPPAAEFIARKFFESLEANAQASESCDTPELNHEHQYSKACLVVTSFMISKCPSYLPTETSHELECVKLSCLLLQCYIRRKLSRLHYLEQRSRMKRFVDGYKQTLDLRKVASFSTVSQQYRKVVMDCTLSACNEETSQTHRRPHTFRQTTKNVPQQLQESILALPTSKCEAPGHDLLGGIRNRLLAPRWTDYSDPFMPNSLFTSR